MMEDKKIINELNIESSADLPRLEDGSLNLEKLVIGKDEKNRLIVSDKVFDLCYKELPDGTTNESRTFKAYNGGKLKTLTSEDAYIQRMGAIASNAKQAQRRSFREAVDYALKKKASKQAIEELQLKEDATNLDMIVAAAMQQAGQGNPKAWEFLRDTVGEKPSTDVNAILETITPEDQEIMKRVAARLDTK